MTASTEVRILGRPALLGILLGLTMNCAKALPIQAQPSGCTTCHGGDEGNPAPPPDLRGNTASSNLGVGAHQAHLNPRDGLSTPVACGDCHLVPTAIHSPGHIVPGQQPSVFPPEIAATSRAFAGQATPTFDRASETCSRVYCHGGGGAPFATDQSAGLHRTPQWTLVGAGQAACGTCHGIPPTDSPHTSSMRLSQCATCHPGSVGSDGLPIVTGPPGHETSLHINGVIDFVGR